MCSPPKLLAGILLLMLPLFFGCATGPTAPPTTLEAQFLTSNQVNPNAAGKPSPIVVRYYELKSATVFENTDFFTLTDTDKSILANDLLGKDEMEMPPAAERTVSRNLDPSTRYLGIVAAYRDLEETHWRVVVPIAPHTPNTFIVRLGKAAISVSGSAAEKRGPADSTDKSKFNF